MTDENNTTFFRYDGMDMQIHAMTREEAIDSINTAFYKAEANGGLDLRLEVNYYEDGYEISIVGRRELTEEDRLIAAEHAENIKRYKLAQYENLKKELGITDE